jgi:hypothetical protein
MLFLWLFTTTLAVVPALHTWLHKDAQSSEHQCTVTAIAQGKCVSCDTNPAKLAPAQEFQIASLTFVSTSLPAISYRPDFGRAPPAIFSNVV